MYNFSNPNACLRNGKVFTKLNSSFVTPELTMAFSITVLFRSLWCITFLTSTVGTKLLSLEKVIPYGLFKTNKPKNIIALIKSTFYKYFKANVNKLCVYSFINI